MVYGFLFVIGLITTLTEWDNIHTTKNKKIRYVFTFPLFMLTYIPIAIAAIFRRVEWTFGIGYGDDYDLAKATIASMLDQDERVLKEPAYFIALSSLGDSSVNIVVRAWTSTGDFWNVFFDMNEKVYKQFAVVGLNIPYPQMDVHIHQ